MARTASRSSLIIGVVLATLISLGSVAGATGLWWAQAQIDQAGVVELEQPSTSASPAGGGLGGACAETCTYLVLGSDSRSGLSATDQREFGSDRTIDGYRADTILLVRIDGRTQHSTVISFPRDLLVEVPGEEGLIGYGDLNLINSAFSWGATDGGVDGVPGGALLSAQTIAQLTGLDINHVVVIDLEGFKAVVDAVGTVPFCTPVKLEDKPEAFPQEPGVENGGSGLYLEAGCHDLDGDTALALVRARYVVAGGVKDCISDYARIQRQQMFMRGLLNKVLSPEVVPQLPGMVEAVTEELTFDKGIKVFDLVALARAMRGLASGSVDFRVVPNQLDEFDKHLELTPAARVFFQKLRSGEPLGELGTELQYQPPGQAEISVRVYDDDSDGHAQGDVYNEQLRDAGFKLMASSAEPAGALSGRGTVILYATGREEEAKVLSTFVPGVDMEKAAKGELPDDTQVAVVVDPTYVYQDPGAGAVDRVTEPCPFT